jgi:hypothetical protein
VGQTKAKVDGSELEALLEEREHQACDTRATIGGVTGGRARALVRELGPQVGAHVARDRSVRRTRAGADAGRAEAAGAAPRPMGASAPARSTAGGLLALRPLHHARAAGDDVPAIYNNNTRIVQAPGYVALTYEMIHETRVIPLDGGRCTAAGFAAISGTRGPVGGDTLVIETRHFSDKDELSRRRRRLHLVERFRRTHRGSATRSRWTTAHVHARLDGGLNLTPGPGSSSTPVTRGTTRCGTCSAPRGRLRHEQGPDNSSGVCPGRGVNPRNCVTKLG